MTFPSHLFCLYGVSLVYKSTLTPINKTAKAYALHIGASGKCVGLSRYDDDLLLG